MVEVTGPTIILHWDIEGGFHWAATPGVAVICVDERTPHDRVYRAEGSLDRETMERVASGEFRDLVDAADAARREGE